jgi:hypothetical protein
MASTQCRNGISLLKKVTMIKISSSPALSKQDVSGTAEQPSSLLQAKRTSRFMLLLAWAFVVLPLVWGLYITEQTAAPLIRTLLSHNH